LVYSEVLYIRGHENISGLHNSTIEFTKEPYCTPRGTCILGVNATKSVAELKPETKRLLNKGAKVRIVISCKGITDVVTGFGDTRLLLENKVSMVIRKSRYIDNRTLVVGADKSASQIDRRLVRALRDRDTQGTVRIELL